MDAVKVIAFAGNTQGMMTVLATHFTRGRRLTGLSFEKASRTPHSQAAAPKSRPATAPLSGMDAR